MNKEMIISSILVILILIADCLTQNYTKTTIKYLTNELKVLKQNLQENDQGKIKEQVDKIEQKWENVHDKLAYYIEHDELEKVENDLTSMKSFIELQDYNLAINEIEKTIFILNHITDKYSFSLVNIF